MVASLRLTLFFSPTFPSGVSVPTRYVLQAHLGPGRRGKCTKTTKKTKQAFSKQTNRIPIPSMTSVLLSNDNEAIVKACCPPPLGTLALINITM